MRKLLTFALLLTAAPALAQNTPSGTQRVQGNPAGYGDPVQVTVTDATGTATPTVVAQGSTTAGQRGGLTQCAVTTTVPGYTTAQTHPLSCDLAGGLRVLPAGNVTSGAADSGNPIKIGGVFNTSGITLTTGQRGDMQLNSAGAVKVDISTGAASAISGSALADTVSNTITRLQVSSQQLGFDGTNWVRLRGDANGLVVQPALSSATWSYAAAASGIVNTVTAVTIKAAAGASVRNYLCSISVAHDVLSGATELAVRDGAAGAVLWRAKLQTAAADTALGAGSITFTPCLRGTANTLLEVVTLTAVTGGVYVNATGTTGI